MKFPECFPVPLPNETLYSILCRYHVRSCNATDNATLLQLFDKRRSLHTTALSPFPLRYAKDWTDAFQGFTRDSLIREHTAFPFYQSFHTCMNSARTSYAADRFFMAMYNRCATPSKRLRYCPKCAQNQWESFGVSYWQVMPQIHGYEVCPIHKELIRETEITHQDIRYTFYPASDVLKGKIKPCDDLKQLHWVEQNMEEYLSLAQDITYLYQYSYTGFHLGLKMQKVLQYDLLPVNQNRVRKFLTDPIDELNSLENDEYYRALIYDPSELISQIYCIPVILQLRICWAMFGNIEKFCTVKVKNYPTI